MATITKKKFDWQIERQRQDKAEDVAQEVLQTTGYSVPVDPLELAAKESPLLRVQSGNFGDAFDGQLEYHSAPGCFLLLFNTRLDVSDEKHSPRTRFSVAHELGHYHLEPHHQYLRSGGLPHPSRAEFHADDVVEKEADAFAAGLLMPTREVSKQINCSNEFNLEAVVRVAEEFEVSLVAAAIRCAKLCHYPAAVAGLRPGKSPWFEWSPMLKDAGCFRRKGIELPSRAATTRLDQFCAGRAAAEKRESRLSEWFTVPDRFSEVLITEEYVPIEVMGTLLVLISADEADFIHE